MLSSSTHLRQRTWFNIPDQTKIKFTKITNFSYSLQTCNQVHLTVYLNRVIVNTQLNLKIIYKIFWMKIFHLNFLLMYFEFKFKNLLCLNEWNSSCVVFVPIGDHTVHSRFISILHTCRRIVTINALCLNKQFNFKLYLELKLIF